MKKIANLRQAMVFLLTGLYDAEKEIHYVMPQLINKASSDSLKAALNNYHDNQSKKIERLTETLQVLNEEVCCRRHETIHNMLKDNLNRLAEDNNAKKNDQLIINHIQIINDYKIADYKACIHFAMAVEEPNISTILSELLEEEKYFESLLDKTYSESSLLCA